ncbi:MAG: hypothetical protein MUO23_03295 [Anaerolineales bacterium]|nr:hypothetical protein [Anaerolineales bacterium]
MTDQPRESKPEKKAEKQEKEREKEQEKTRGSDEKHWDEKVRRDPFGTTLWGLILLWAGLVLLASNLGWLGPLAFLAPWSLILLGAAAILFLGVAVVLMVPAYRRPVGGLVVLACLLLVGGLGSSFGLMLLGPALLIGFGALILVRALRR